MLSNRSMLWRKFLLALVLVTPFSLSVSIVGYAQTPSSAWSRPELLFSTPVGYNSDELWLLRDQLDTLYVWWPVFPTSTNQAPDSQARTTVYHTEWHKGRWDEPVDILLSPAAGGLTSAVMDNTGTIHAFSATDCVSYVTARYDKAMDSKAWSTRRCIDGTGNSYVSAAQGDDGTIYVAYAAPGTQTLHLARSRDKGVTWSISSIASVQQSNDGFFAEPALAIDSKNRLHLVWTLYAPPDGYPPLGIFYARSDDAGSSWTLPISLGRPDEGQPAIAVHGDEVHVLWNGDSAKKGRYYRNSKDGGKTWSPIEALTPAGVGGGLQRPPALIVDNVGHVHALIHDTEVLSYMMKDEQGWSAKEPLYVPQALSAKEIFAVRLAITGGDRLNAVYTLATGNARTKRIYYQYRTIDAVPTTPVPGFTSVPAETKSVLPTQSVATATFTPQPSQVPPLVDNPSANTPIGTDSPTFPLVAGLFPAAVLVGIVIFVRSLGRR